MVVEGEGEPEITGASIHIGLRKHRPNTRFIFSIKIEIINLIQDCFVIIKMLWGLVKMYKKKVLLYCESKSLNMNVFINSWICRQQRDVIYKSSLYNQIQYVLAEDLQIVYNVYNLDGIHISPVYILYI